MEWNNSKLKRRKARNKSHWCLRLGRQQEIKCLIQRKETAQEAMEKVHRGREGRYWCTSTGYQNLTGISLKGRNIKEMHKDERTFWNAVLEGSLQAPEGPVLKAEKWNSKKWPRKDLEDPKWHEHLAIPSDIPPILPPEYQCDVGPPIWKEVERAVHQARIASAPGPNGAALGVWKLTWCPEVSLETDENIMTKEDHTQSVAQGSRCPVPKRERGRKHQPVSTNIPTECRGQRHLLSDCSEDFWIPA